jgi:hypothetical protein
MILKLDYALHYTIIKGETLKTLILFWCLFHDYCVDYYNSNAFFWVVRLVSICLEWCLKDTSPLILNQNPLTYSKVPSLSARKRCS